MNCVSTFNFDLSENVAYNNTDFPAYIREGLLSSYPDYSALSHWHEDFEFIYILDGAMSYNVNGELMHFSKGEGIFVNSRQLHYGFSSEHTECDFYCVLLHPALLSSNRYFTDNYVFPFMNNTALPHLALRPSLPYQQDILKLVKAIFLEKDQNLSAFSIQQHFFEIFHLLYENCPPPAITENTLGYSEELNTLKTMILFIQAHYQERISLAQIAGSGSCCKSKCSNIFHKYLRESPITYLIKYRLSQSLPMLLEKQKTISEIALDCGFSGVSYYCELFRKYYMLTPSEYRKK